MTERFVGRREISHIEFMKERLLMDILMDTIVRLYVNSSVQVFIFLSRPFISVGLLESIYILSWNKLGI